MLLIAVGRERAVHAVEDKVRLCHEFAHFALARERIIRHLDCMHGRVQAHGCNAQCEACGAAGCAAGNIDAVRSIQLAVGNLPREFEAGVHEACRTDPACSAQRDDPHSAVLQMPAKQRNLVDAAAPANDFGAQLPVHVERAGYVWRGFLMGKKTRALEVQRGRVDRRCQRMVRAGRAESCNATGTPFSGSPQQVLELANLVAAVHCICKLIMFERHFEGTGLQRQDLRRYGGRQLRKRQLRQVAADAGVSCR